MNHKYMILHYKRELIKALDQDEYNHCIEMISYYIELLLNNNKSFNG